MMVLLSGIIIIAASGMAALLMRRSNRLATALGVGGGCLGSLIGLIPAVGTLMNGSSVSLHLPWHFPGGAFSVAIDPLSAFFLIPIFVISALAAVYGAGYLQHYTRTRSLGPHWFFFNQLVAGMAMVVIARNGLLFLISWEVMSLAPFFLVTFLNEKASVRDAGWVYLTATHLGVVFLLLFFLMMGKEAGSMDFDRFNPATCGHLSLLFMMAFIGFGSKAGFMPFHVWLPEAHPAAPSHVSALMSAVMIKMGIYGLLRALILLGHPPAWWGYLLIGTGLFSGIAGVIFALAQHDLKRLLAYSSVENIGIISMGTGIGILGINANHPVLAVLGFGGAMMHVLNHSFFKSLLFLGAGSVQHAAGTLRIDQMGGLLKPMPVTGMACLAGVVAICGLPPFNGFVSEFLIYRGAVTGSMVAGGALTGSMVAVIAGLALIGGFAAVCFAKVFGVAFLGEARSMGASCARECSAAMKIPMMILALLCLLAGLTGPVIMKTLAPALNMMGLSAAMMPPGALNAADLPSTVTWAFTGLILISAALFLFKKWLLSKRHVQEAVTWDCGYIRPTARMQYTASSFVQPVVAGFSHGLLQTRFAVSHPVGQFPVDASLATETPDVIESKFYSPLFNGIDRLLSRLRWIQHGRVQLYVTYIVITLIFLLMWKLR